MEWAPCPSSYNALKAGSIDGTDVVPHDHAILRAMNSKYTPPSSLKSVPEKTLFIGRLSQTVSEEEVHEVYILIHNTTIRIKFAMFPTQMFNSRMLYGY